MTVAQKFLNNNDTKNIPILVERANISKVHDKIKAANQERLRSSSIEKIEAFQHLALSGDTGPQWKRIFNLINEHEDIVSRRTHEEKYGEHIKFHTNTQQRDPLDILVSGAITVTERQSRLNQHSVKGVLPTITKISEYINLIHEAETTNPSATAYEALSVKHTKNAWDIQVGHYLNKQEIKKKEQESQKEAHLDHKILKNVSNLSNWSRAYFNGTTDEQQKVIEKITAHFEHLENHPEERNKEIDVIMEGIRGKQEWAIEARLLISQRMQGFPLYNEAHEKEQNLSSITEKHSDVLEAHNAGNRSQALRSFAAIRDNVSTAEIKTLLDSDLDIKDDIFAAAKDHKNTLDQARISRKSFAENIQSIATELQSGIKGFDTSRQARKALSDSIKGINSTVIAHNNHIVRELQNTKSDTSTQTKERLAENVITFIGTIEQLKAETNSQSGNEFFNKLREDIMTTVSENLKTYKGIDFGKSEGLDNYLTVLDKFASYNPEEQTKDKSVKEVTAEEKIPTLTNIVKEGTVPFAQAEPIVSTQPVEPTIQNTENPKKTTGLTSWFKTAASKVVSAIRSTNNFSIEPSHSIYENQGTSPKTPIMA